MKLCPASDAPKEDLRYMVRSVAVSKIYYVWTGRNAWWSTWATRYSPGCFHTTIESAKRFCESRRVQGTVFYIDELPVLTFYAPERAIFAIEINTEHFLGKLDQDLLASVTNILPVSTMTLRQMHCMFKPGSPIWPSRYPGYNSMLVTYGSGDQKPEVVAITDELFSYKSYGQGATYLLGWERRPFNKNRSTLHAVASLLEGRLGEL